MSVHRVKDKNRLVKRYRFIPYDEIVEVIKGGDIAFLEGPFKRQTVWKAARKLSEMIGKKVKAERTLFRLPDGGSLEGYSFSVTEES